MGEGEVITDSILMLSVKEIVLVSRVHIENGQSVRQNTTWILVMNA